MATKTIKFEPTNVGDEIILDNKALVNMKLLWTNANPTSQFLAQTIAADNTDRKQFYIAYRLATLSQYSDRFGVLIGEKNQTYSISYLVGGNLRVRTIEVTDSGFVFGNNGVLNSYGSSTQVDNTCLIPLSIYELA